MPSSRAALPETAGRSLIEQMARNSSALWVCVGDERGPVRLVPIYESCDYRELVIRGCQVVTETHREDGIWEYRPSREEAEWRADLYLDFARGAHCMKAYPKPLGVFRPRRRVTMSVEQITAMFGEIAA